MQTIAEQLQSAIEKLEVEINQHRFCTLIFKIQDGKFIRFNKDLTITREEIDER
jgi:hypothetical protein